MEYMMCSPKALMMAKTLSWQKSYARAMASSKPKNAFSASTLRETPKQLARGREMGGTTNNPAPMDQGGNKVKMQDPLCEI